MTVHERIPPAKEGYNGHWTSDMERKATQDGILSVLREDRGSVNGRFGVCLSGAVNGLGEPWNTDGDECYECGGDTGTVGEWLEKHGFPTLKHLTFDEEEWPGTVPEGLAGAVNTIEEHIKALVKAEVVKALAGGDDLGGLNDRVTDLEAQVVILEREARTHTHCIDIDDYCEVNITVEGHTGPPHGC